jgi:signal transduction histidine kinase
MKALFRLLAVIAVVFSVGALPSRAELPPAVSARALELARTIEREQLFARQADWDMHLERAQKRGPEPHMRALFQIASYHLTQGDNEAAHVRALELQTVAKAAGNSRFQRLAEIALLSARETSDSVEPLRALIAREAQDPLVRAVGHLHLGEVLREAGAAVEAVKEFTAARELLGGGDPLEADIRRDLSGYLAQAHDELGDYAGAVAEYERSIGYAREAPRRFDGVSFLFNFALMLSRAEAHALARDVAEIERRVALETKSPIEVFYADALCANLARERQDWLEARQCADRALQQPAQDATYAAHMLWTRTIAHARLGQARAARADYQAMMADPFYTGSDDGALRRMRAEAEVLQAERRFAEAFALLRDYSEAMNQRAIARFNHGSMQLRAQLETDLAKQRERAEAAALLAERQGIIILLGVGLAVLIGLALFWKWQADRQARRLLLQARASLEQRASILRATVEDLGGAVAEAAAPTKQSVHAELVWLLEEIDRRDRALADAVTTLRASRSAAEEASAAKSQFLAVVSHELRTPLNAIIGYSELMREELQDGRALDAADLERVTRAAHRLLTLINQILRFERLRHAPDDLRVEAVSTAALLQQAAEIIRPLTMESRVALEIDVGPGAEHIETDAAKLSQALINIAGNAAKFTPSGTISLGAARMGNEIVFSVTDTGIGIPAEKLPTIFEAFTQVDSSLSRTHEGTGLGLAISKEIAEALGGVIAVQSAIGQGSRFTIALPLHPPRIAAQAA